MLSVSTYYMLKDNQAIYQGVGLSYSAWNEMQVANNIKHREKSKGIVTLTYLLGTGNAKTFLQQYKLIKLSYK